MNAPLQLGVIGLGRAFTLMLPTFARHPLIKLTSASDPRADARARFARDFNATVYENAEDLCADPSVQAVYVASPHQFHKTHVKLAASHGKHVLVEKPMALTIEECRDMIAIARDHGVHLLVGHSHSYDAPYLRVRELVQSSLYGDVRMITALNYTDFLYRPRRPEELDTSAGGGVVFSQAAHQIDVVRLLAGKKAFSVRALSGRWDPARPTEGAYNAQILFEGGTFASLTYSGYGRFDTDEFNEWVGELGQKRDPNSYGTARKLLRTASTIEDEIALKNRRAYGPAGTEAFQPSGQLDHNHFGLVVVSCERADLRPTPREIIIHGDDERTIESIRRPDIPRAEVADELYEAATLDKAPLHSGEWGLATLEICLAILESAKTNREIELLHQI
ncbi:MAG: Gfo/Idh/MocA family oxidoreductase [Pseudomonadota bacterium]